MKRQKILVAVDGSDNAFEAVRYVSKTSSFHKMQIVLFHVLAKIPENYWDMERHPLFGNRVREVRAWEKQNKKVIEDFMEKAKTFLVESGVPKDIPPYVIAAGDRARLHGLNNVGLKRHGFSEDTLSLLKKTYRIIFRIGLTLNEAIERVAAEVEQIPEVVKLIEFIKSSQRGITR